MLSRFWGISIPHESYHSGKIKMTLLIAGLPIDDKVHYVLLGSGSRVTTNGLRRKLLEIECVVGTLFNEIARISEVCRFRNRFGIYVIIGTP